jgi:hypothetical protein
MAVDARRAVIVSARELKRPPAKFERIVQRWDTASKATELTPTLPSPASATVFTGFSLRREWLA